MYSEIRRLTIEDLDSVLSDPLNEGMRQVFSEKLKSFLCDDENSVAFVVKNKVVVVGGVSMYWSGRGKIWSLFTSDLKHNFVPIFRLMKKYVDRLPVRRVEVDVPYGDENLMKRAEMLGFSKYADRARRYNSFGDDCTLFERINENGR